MAAVVASVDRQSLRWLVIALVAALFLAVIIILNVLTMVSGHDGAIASVAIDPVSGRSITMFIDPTTREPVPRSLAMVVRSTKSLTLPVGMTSAIVLCVALLSLQRTRRTISYSQPFPGEPPGDSRLEDLRKAGAAMSGTSVTKEHGETLDPEEIIDRGERIYQEELREQLEHDHWGKYLVIDILTHEYVLADSDVQAITEAQSRFKGSPKYSLRIGVPFHV